MKQPPCANWRIWYGKEIEGVDGVGQETLFVRDGTLEELVQYARDFKRVWFTKEFTTWYIVLGMIEQRKQVCLEVTPETLPTVPTKVLQGAIVYLKLGHKPFNYVDAIDSKHVNYVSQGNPFYETTYKLVRNRLVEGTTVAPDDYGDDVRLA